MLDASFVIGGKRTFRKVFSIQVNRLVCTKTNPIRVARNVEHGYVVAHSGIASVLWIN